MCTHKAINLLRGISSRHASLWFKDVPMGPPDAILGLTEAFNRDQNSKKINLGAGTYRDDDGKPFVLPSVKMAEKKVVESNADKEYAGIGGIAKFCYFATRLAFGSESPVLEQRLNATVQAISGTGALRVAAAFLEKFNVGPKTVWVPNPTWNNHFNIFRHAGLEIKSYRYYNPATCGIDEEGLLNDLMNIPEKSILLLHCCAHNPTGVDLNTDQWKKISDIVKQRKLFPFFDMAYQGFASGDVDKDAYSIRLFVREGHQMALAQSFSKNMGLYGERVGTLTILGSNEEEVQRVLSQLKIIIRPMISNPPIHGARIAQFILSDPALTAQWMKDLKVMTERIKWVRKTLKELLESGGSKRSWQHIVDQIGMFCYSGLNETEVDRLIKDYSIYLTKDGRISVAGVNSANINYLASAINEVTKS